jgi:glycosyltransferase involved in cell wall biosynthesis
VLVFSYFLPPVGGGTSLRNAGVIRRLAELGYAPTVITGSGQADHYWAPHAELETEAFLSGAKIIHVPGPEPVASRGLRRRIERMLDLKSPWYGWWLRGAFEAARRECADADLIYVSMEPYETAFLASRLSREFDKPWVADLLDPWALDEVRLHVSAPHRWRDHSRMNRTLGTAAAVIMNTPEARGRAARELPRLAGSILEAIALGYEGRDFETPAPERYDGTFRIVHTGFFHTEAGLRHRRRARLRQAAGGLYSPIDILTRTPLYLMQAVNALIEKDPSLREVVEIHFAGSLTDADKAVIGDSPFVHAHGYVPHHETVALMRSADLLFLPLYDVPRGRRSGLVPGKLYEYLASGRPILAALPEGDARDILTEAGSAHVCLPSDVGAMTKAIELEVERWRSGAPPSQPRPEVVARYERSALTERLAAVFDEILAQRQRRAGSLRT